MISPCFFVSLFDSHLWCMKERRGDKGLQALFKAFHIDFNRDTFGTRNGRTLNACLKSRDRDGVDIILSLFVRQSADNAPVLNSPTQRDS